jgi:hypothetical protein
MAAVICSLSFAEGAAIIGVCFPLFVVTASFADHKKPHNLYRSPQGTQVRLPRLPVFAVAVGVANFALKLGGVFVGSLGAENTRHSGRRSRSR